MSKFILDSAVVYNNEADIGLALKELLPKYNLKREDIFLTSKLGKFVDLTLFIFVRLLIHNLKL